MNAAGELIRKSVRKDAAIYFSMAIDESLEDNVKLTLIATGLGNAGFKLPKGPKLGLFGRNKDKND